MRIARPVAITATELTDTDLFETVPTAWNSGTTYNADDIASVANSKGNGHVCYVSQAGSNLNNDPSTDDGTWWLPFCTVYGAYNAGTTYYADDIVTDTTNHLLYQSVWQNTGDDYDDPSNQNTGNALTDTDWWYPLGNSNQLAAFDYSRTNATQAYDSFFVEITTTGIVDTIGFINMVGVTGIDIVVTDDAVEVLNESYNMMTGVNNWWDYFLNPITNLTDYAVTALADLTITDDSVLVITITFTGAGNMSVGEIVLGKGRVLGSTQYPLNLGIVDYSVIEEDSFGTRSILQRDFVKTMDAEIWVEAANTSFVYSLLAALRSTPILAIASTTYPASVQFGIPKMWNERIQYPTHSIMDFSFQGL